MKCEWVQQNVLLYVYDELPDDARHELEQHVVRCKSCAAELESVKNFRADFAQFPMRDPSPSFLAASRMRLQEGLESAEQGGWWSRLIFDPVHWLNQVRFAPALAAAIFIVGFAGGIGATYKMVEGASRGYPRTNHRSLPSLRLAASVPSPSSPAPTRSRSNMKPYLRRRPTVPSVIPTFSSFFCMRRRNNFNAGVRMDSVNLLTQQPNNIHVREALLYALRYDSNTGVRLKALDSLGPYVKDDVQVRDAVLESLMSDANPGVRIEALRLLEPARADGSVRIVLQRLAAKDENRYIRSQARTLVAQLPEMN